MVIVPIWKKVDEKTGVLNAASSVAEILKTAGLKVKLDDADQRTPGWKFNFWEMKVSLYLNVVTLLLVILKYESLFVNFGFFLKLKSHY